MKLTDYTWEIFEIAKEQDVDIGVARDMFIANLENAGEAGAPHYAGADGLDYGALKGAWEAMAGQERGEAREAFTALTRAHYKALTACRREGDREGFEAIVAESCE